MSAAAGVKRTNLNHRKCYEIFGSASCEWLKSRESSSAGEAQTQRNMLLLLLWTVILSARARAQSGDADPSLEPTLSCLSDISWSGGSNISCRLVSSCYNLEDDEDEDCDHIENITACQAKKSTCAKCDLPPASSAFSCPKPVSSARLPRIRLRFQIQLWSEETNQTWTENLTSDSMNMAMNRLHSGTQYHVKARAIPFDPFEGTWSEWSRPMSFQTPPGSPDNPVKTLVPRPENPYILLWSIVPVVVAGCVVLIWKNKILTYMWPSIPHPKTTLEQIRTQIMVFC
ncbi:hypothetical protein WMY93_021101 [Mugilogobius chulae]|uniref:Fibronectin type-III domain-containing protein n=1 Tax=Mugilogobius chulae TaxID=88201 RepID=A0AAW0NE00_9GOBI